MSKICPKCQTQNRMQGKFCVTCGTPLPIQQPATEIFRPPPQPSTEFIAPNAEKPKKRSALWFLLPILALVLIIGAVVWVLLFGGNGDNPIVAVFEDDATATVEVAEEDVTVEVVAEDEDESADPEPTQAAPSDAPTSEPEESPDLQPTATPDGLLFSDNGLQVYRERSAETGIRIEIRYADGSPKINSGAAIFNQTTDVSGNTTYDSRIDNGRTDQTGAIFFALNEGSYAIGLGDLLGGSWGNPFDYEVTAGNVTVVSLTLGELVIGVRNVEEQPVDGRYTAVFEQIADINGNPTKGERISNGRTNNTGTVVYAMVPGTYAVEIGDIIGQPWGSEIGHVVESGKTTQVVITLGRITIGVENALGQPVAGRYVAVLQQTTDVQGNPAKGARIINARTDDRGIVQWDITAGTYAVEIGDVIGEAWGSETGHVVTSGEETTLVLTLGRLRVGLEDVDGNPIEGRYVEVHHREADVNGNSVLGARIVNGRTDNRGLVEWDMTAGTYIVTVADLGEVLDVGVEAGKIAFADGTGWEIREE